MQTKDKAHSLQRHVQKFVAAVLSLGDKRVQVVQDKVVSVAPQWTGGGVALGPKPRSYRFSVNKKIKRIALKSALSAKYADYKIFVIDELAVDEIKTAKIVALLKGLDVNSKALIVTADADEKVYKSARNIKGVTPTHVGTLNTYDVLNNDAFIVSKDAIAKIEEVLA